MRGFVDRARDYLESSLFDPLAAVDIKRVLEFHSSLRSKFSITEEDIDNVENLLSLAELSAMVPELGIGDGDPGLADSIRHFVEAVLVKSVNLPAPHSAEWIGLDSGPSQKYLVSALAYYGERVSIISLNYDCVVEYVCHCLGVPFTYNRKYGEGVELLKLHGSINWVICQTPGCARLNKPTIVESTFKDATDGSGGTIEPELASCPECSKLLRPYIVPPTWDKNLSDENGVLAETWKRAAEVLQSAETMVAIGYSLPEADPKVRELIHAGLAPGRLRQALIYVGQDELAAARWTDLFRPAWRSGRLDMRVQNYEPHGKEILLAALSLKKESFGNTHLQLLPFPQSPGHNGKMLAQLGATYEKSQVTGVDWSNVARLKRQGRAPTQATMQHYEEILHELGLDWVPGATILPSHGSTFHGS
jgi:hypothetical protein